MADDPTKPKIIVEQWSPAPRVRVLQTQTDEERARCVDLLRGLLRQAEEGKMLGLAVIALTGSDAYSLTWTNVNQNNLARYIGGCVILQNLLCSRAQLTQDAAEPKAPPPKPEPQTPPTSMGEA